MTWVKLDDQFFDHRKVIRAGRDARDLFLVAVAFCSAQLTDGFVAQEDLETLAFKAFGPGKDPSVLAEKLVSVGLWETVPGGWQIHDYHDFNPTAEAVRAERERARERMSRARSQGGDDLFNGSSGEVRAKFGRSSTNPGPGPGPETNSEGANAPSAAAAATRAERGRQMWRGMTEAGLPEPRTRTERGRRNTAIRDLLDAGESPEAIGELVSRFRERYPSVDCTETALSANLRNLREPLPSAKSGKLGRAVNGSSVNSAWHNATKEKMDAIFAGAEPGAH